jgi:hypothetical protein
MRYRAFPVADPALFAFGWTFEVPANAKLQFDVLCFHFYLSFPGTHLPWFFAQRRDFDCNLRAASIDCAPGARRVANM